METGAIDRFVSEVRAREARNLISMRLFGSRARREGDEESDYLPEIPFTKDEVLERLAETEAFIKAVSGLL